MEDKLRYEMLGFEKVELIFSNPQTGIKYVDRRGNEFDNKYLCRMSDDEFAREDYYNHLLSKRNWLRRFFNVKPSMRFYDEMVYRSNFLK